MKERKKSVQDIITKNRSAKEGDKYTKQRQLGMHADCREVSASHVVATL